MHDHPMIFICALLLFSYGIFSRLSEKSIVTGPMFFVSVGMLIGPIGLNLFELHFDAEVIKILSEITLIIILFVDASLIRFTTIKQTLSGIPARLLLVGLPLTMGVGSIVAWLFFPDLNIWLIILIALILSPTDAALGQAVIKSDKVPSRIRESVSIESGLNDGIVLPLILLCIAVLDVGRGAMDGSGNWVEFMALQLSLGPIIGGAVGWVGGKIVDKAVSKGWMDKIFQSLSAVSLALMAYAFAELFYGNGFIAAFFAGLFLRIDSTEVRERLQSFGEAEGQMLSLFIFFVVGLAAIPFAVSHITLSVVIYSIASLTLIRMVPVAISLIGSGVAPRMVFFIGWFGPRGIASILYLLIAIGTLGTKGYETAYSVVILTIVLSTFLHGATAVPFCNIIASQKQ